MLHPDFSSRMLTVGHRKTYKRAELFSSYDRVKTEQFCIHRIISTWQCARTVCNGLSRYSHKHARFTAIWKFQRLFAKVVKRITICIDADEEDTDSRRPVCGCFAG